MKNKTVLAIFIVILLTAVITALDLENYPQPFIKESGDFDALIIIGDDSSDAISAADILLGLQREALHKQVIGNATIQTLIPIKKTAIVVSSEVEDFTLHNTILVGGPCVNPYTSYLMGYPLNCMNGFEPGKAIIKLYKHDNGNYALVVAGTRAIDTRRAASVISDHENYDIKGEEVVTYDTSSYEITVKER